MATGAAAARPAITAIPSLRPRWARWRHDNPIRAAEWLSGHYAVLRLRRAVAITDPLARVAAYARLRAAYDAVAAGQILSMESATRDLRTERPLAAGPALSRIDGPGFIHDAALFYIPGGSFLVARSPRLTAMIARIARAAGVPAIVCDYRLAPEFPYPAAIDDIEAAIAVVTAQGLAPERIVIVAESAGGALALSALARLRLRGMMPAGLVLLSPWLDLDPARRELHPLTRLCARLYLAGADPHDPRANPAWMAMARLPPMLIHGHRGDSLFGDATRLAERAARAGVAVELHHWPGALHVAERFDTSDSQRSIAEIANFVARQLALRRHAA